METLVTETTPITTEINHSWFLVQKPEKIWNYLTQPEFIRQWLTEDNFEAIVGHSFQLMASPEILSDSVSVVNCKVIEIVNPKRISFSWAGRLRNGGTELDLLIEWTLNARRNATELQLRLSGFTNANTFVSHEMAEWWIRKVEKMITLIHA
jgi:uncharacterized protein YndB with AHSA1/START domain